jgi:ubiquinone/menaquinone biosynthesis C-methylase UbiE
VGFYLGGSEKLPFENQTFDSVVSTFTLCSIPDVELALWELHRVLKKGGKLFFLEHGLSEEPKVAERQKRWTPWQKRLADGCHLDRDMGGLISSAGFEFQDMKTYYFPKGFKMFSYFYQGVAQKTGAQSHS